MSIGVATGVMGLSWPVNRPGTARSRNSAQCKPGASFALLYATALLGPLDRRRGRGAAGQGLIADLDLGGQGIGAAAHAVRAVRRRQGDGQLRARLGLG